MDPVSVVAATLAVSAISANIVKFFDKIRKAVTTDDKFDTMHFRLIAEQKRTAAWANSLRRIPGSSLQEQIPPEEFEQVEEILRRLQKAYQRANEKFSKVRLDVVDGKLLPNLVQRAHWHTIGYEDLNVMLELIATLNKTLKIIAPPPPLYSPPISVTAQPGPQVLYSTTVAPNSSSDGAINSGTGSMVTQPIASAISTSAVTSIGTVFTACLEGLRGLGAQNEFLRDSARATAMRLQLWGIGLFQVPASLDTVLEIGSPDYEGLRNSLLRMLVEIAVTEEHILKAFSKGQDGLDQISKDILASISDLLGTEEIIEAALRQWSNLLVEDSDNEAPEQMLTRIGGHMDFIVKMVEILYGMIPNICSAQRMFLLRSDQKAEASPSPILRRATLLADEADIKPVNLIEENLKRVQLVEERLKRDKQEPLTEIRIREAYSGLLRKEKERLEEWRITAQEDSAAAQRVNGSLEVAKMQKELNKALVTWSYQHPSDKKRLSFESKPISSQTDLDELLRLCQTSTSHLWSVSRG